MSLGTQVVSPRWITSNGVHRGREQLDWLLTQKPIGAYVGVDPTAPSMHVGHLLPFMALFWLYLSGYPSVTLVSAVSLNPTRPL